MGCSWLTTFKLEQSRSTSFTSCVLCLTIGITIGKSYWYIGVGICRCTEAPAGAAQKLRELGMSQVWRWRNFAPVHSCSQFSSKNFLQRNSISPSFCPGALLLQSPVWHIDFPAGAASNCGLEIHRSCLKACDGMCAVFAWHAVLVEMCFCLLAAFQFSPLAGSPAAPANSSGLFFANSFQAACHEFICLQRVWKCCCVLRMPLERTLILTSLPFIATAH